MADVIARDDCLAGGSTVFLDGNHPVANLASHGWNLISRLKRWASGSFIFCEAAAFRQVGGLAHDLYASEEIELFERFKGLLRAPARRRS